MSCCADPAAAQERFRISDQRRAAGVDHDRHPGADLRSVLRAGIVHLRAHGAEGDDLRPRASRFDCGAALHAGAAVSVFDDKSGTGTVTARVPHPLQFNKPRTTTGEIAGRHAARGRPALHGRLERLRRPRRRRSSSLHALRRPVDLRDRSAVRHEPDAVARQRSLPVRRAAFPGVETETRARERDGLQRRRRHDVALRPSRRRRACCCGTRTARKQFAPTGAGQAGRGDGRRIARRRWLARAVLLTRPARKPPPPKPPPSSRHRSSRRRANRLTRTAARSSDRHARLVARESGPHTAPPRSTRPSRPQTRSGRARSSGTAAIRRRDPGRAPMPAR